jgi:hypothetical protein
MYIMNVPERSTLPAVSVLKKNNREFLGPKKEDLVPG